MTEIKHTPGPWTLHKHAFACVVSEKMMVANCAATTSNTDDLQPTQIANARLIAAAPDLLEALKRALPYVDDVICKDGGIDHCQIEYRVDHETIVAAIAKAEGRS